MIESDGSVKEKLRNIVKDYIRFFPVEYADFKAGMKEKRDRATHRTGKIDGAEILDRPLHEIPETMYGIINMHLTEEELKVFQSQGMSRWFAKNFKEFSIIERL